MGNSFGVGFNGGLQVPRDGRQRFIKDFDIRVGNGTADKAVDIQNDGFDARGGFPPRRGEGIAALVARLRVGGHISLLRQIAKDAGNLTAIHLHRARQLALRQAARCISTAQAARVRAREGKGFHLRGLELGDGFGRAGHQRGKLFESTGIQGHSSFPDE